MIYTQKRKRDVINALNLDANEIKESTGTRWFIQSFSSIEYHLIIHLTNEELYYLDEETEQSLNNADEIINTEMGRVYAFK